MKIAHTIEHAITAIDNIIACDGYRETGGNDWLGPRLMLVRDVLTAQSKSEEKAATSVIPPAVRIALTIALNHVEPGWSNCVTVIQAWLEGAL